MQLIDRPQSAHPSGSLDWRTVLAEDDQGHWQLQLGGIGREQQLSLPANRECVLVLLDEGLLLLQQPGKAPLHLQQRFQQARLHGKAMIAVRALEAPVQWFGVDSDPHCFALEVLARPLVDAMLLFAEADTLCLVHLLSGQAVAESSGQTQALAAGQTLASDWRQADEGRVILKGAGELVLVKLRDSAGN